MKPAIAFIFLLVITLARASAMKPDADRLKVKVKARDAITLSISETKEIRKFVDLIPKFKILQITHQAQVLNPCVDLLVRDLESLEYSLHQMRHLKKTKLQADVSSVRKYATHGVYLGRYCYNMFKNVDEIVPGMLAGKLYGLSVAVNTAVHQVSLMNAV